MTIIGEGLRGDRPAKASLGACLNGADAPVVILVAPQMGENIGSTARAMFNFGLHTLRLVAPRDGWPNPRAEAAASGAGVVLERAEVFADTAAAIADLHRVFATTARHRDMTQPIITPRAAAGDLHRVCGECLRCGLLFGPERTGLTNDDLSCADTVISIPVNPAFPSLNLAQAVLLVAYEWFQAGAGAQVPERELHTGQSRPATKGELANLHGHLARMLDERGFFLDPEKRPSMLRNLRNALQRMVVTEQEVRTAHGILTALVAPPRSPR